MKAIKITYWITTILTGLLFTLSSFMYLTHAPKLVEGFGKLGYPLYMLNILGIAKFLAGLAVLIPKFPKLKEWAYAGLVFVLIGAIWSHAASGDTAGAFNPVLPFILLITSYITWHLLQSKNAATGNAIA